MGYDPEGLLKQVVAQHQLADAHDPAAVLQYRLNRAARLRHTRPTGPTRIVAGLVLTSLGSMTLAYRRALDDRAALIPNRAEVWAAAALAANEPWVRRLGGPARDPVKQNRR